MNHAPTQVKRIIQQIQALGRCPLCKRAECDCWAPIVSLVSSHDALVAAIKLALLELDDDYLQSPTQRLREALAAAGETEPQAMPEPHEFIADMRQDALA